MCGINKNQKMQSELNYLMNNTNGILLHSIYFNFIKLVCTYFQNQQNRIHFKQPVNFFALVCEKGSEKAPVIVQTNSIAMTKFRYGWNEFWVERKKETFLWLLRCLMRTLLFAKIQIKYLNNKIAQIRFYTCWLSLSPFFLWSFLSLAGSLCFLLAHSDLCKQLSASSTFHRRILSLQCVKLNKHVLNSSQLCRSFWIFNTFVFPTQ